MSRASPTGVVGIGASAGGLSALTHFVSAVPADTGLAFVILQHQAESQLGKLAGILGPVAAIPVVDAEHGARLVPDQAYIVPPHTRAAVVDGALVLEPSSKSPHKPIDGLLASLGRSQGAKAVGVVLSGTGNDGTDGLRAIRSAGGVTVAQDPVSAEFDEMPRSAIAAGVVDVVMSADKLGREIASLRSTAAHSDGVTRILDHLRELAGIDFSTYKRATIERRLDRQLVRHRFGTLAEYANYLVEHPAEARTLYEDLLVHVTEFFRDREIFEEVRARALPEIIAGKSDGAPIRVWIPGCSTGEEVYSFAIMLLELLAERGDSRSIQLFGTDLSERAIEMARAGRYPSGIEHQVDAERLRTFFTPDGAGYRVAASVRERCVFVRHDLAADPPFSRLDLVSCRNVLIYLGPSLQKRVIELLHYALEQPGFLLLGRSEAIAGQDALFTALEPGLPLYRRKPIASRSIMIFGGRTTSIPRRVELVQTVADLYRQADHVLLARYAPACVLVDENFDIIQFRGRTGAFLEPAPGHPQLNLFKMAREGLGPDLRNAAQRAQRDEVPVRADGVTMANGDETRTVDIEVIPVRTGTAPRHFLVVFEERSPVARPAKKASRNGGADLVEPLQQELAATREYLATVLAQHVATTEELGVLNEEMQSANEELQSSNEELQTTKEELQSTNDELESVNAELGRGNLELRKLNDDLLNVLASVDLAIIIVDAELNVRRFTPPARALFKLIEGDIGRPIDDLQPSFPIGDLGALIRGVIDSLVVAEREVRDDTGRWHRMHVRPYRTSDQHIGGAVITFVDVTVLRQSIEDSRRAREAEREAREHVSRERDAFLNAVSHELRTPLNAILLWTAVIRDLAAANPEILHAIDTIETSARAETQLVEDMLDLALSRTNRSALLVGVVTVAPCPIVEETAAALRIAADEKRITLDLDLDHDLRTQADPRRLRQIVWHLLTNAIKFTPPDGRVKVSVSRTGENVELAVSDNGKGIRADLLPTVFEPFSQEDLSSTRTHAGLGIGLAFVRHLVERQAGTIAVTSAGEGRGATFTVRLPAA